MDDYCDYCGEKGEHLYLRILGFTEDEGEEFPLVKIWCGDCEPGDEIDLAAYTAFAAYFDKED